MAVAAVTVAPFGGATCGQYPRICECECVITSGLLSLLLLSSPLNFCLLSSHSITHNTSSLSPTAPPSPSAPSVTRSSQRQYPLRTTERPPWQEYPWNAKARTENNGFTLPSSTAAGAVLADAAAPHRSRSPTVGKRGGGGNGGGRSRVRSRSPNKGRRQINRNNPETSGEEGDAGGGFSALDGMDDMEGADGMEGMEGEGRGMLRLMGGGMPGLEEVDMDARGGLLMDSPDLMAGLASMGAEGGSVADAV